MTLAALHVEAARRVSQDLNVSFGEAVGGRAQALVDRLELLRQQSAGGARSWPTHEKHLRPATL
eukprot:6717028-Pyramimonas_sp.AAC.1